MTARAHRLRVYLAGPDVFFPNARDIGAAKKRICAEYHFDGVFPLDNELREVAPSKAAAAEAIFSANCAAMDSADVMIANMMPFRGPSTDAGTAFEIGYMYAQNKPIFGYGSDSVTYLERVLKVDPAARDAMTLDRHGMHIEDFGLVDNLMIACAVGRQGIDVISHRGRWDDLSGFRECVRVASERLRSASH
jgi:nucleoside 2-deoxyribosyltransferase